MTQSLISAIPTFPGLDGLPLTGGYVYFGDANQDPRQYPKDVFYDKDLTVPASQPLRTNSGFLWRNGSPTSVWAAGSGSLLVLDAQQRQVYYFPDWSGIGIVADITAVASNAANITAVAGNVASVNAVAGAVANVSTVAGAVASVNTTAGSIANVNTVAGSIANVNTVGANIADVNEAAASVRIFASTAAGIAGTSSGQYFYVVSATATYTLELWKNNAGVAQDTTKRWIDASTFPEDLVPGKLWGVKGANGNIGMTLDEDDVLDVKALRVNRVPVVNTNLWRKGNNFTFQLNFINGFGESTMEGSSDNTGLTTAQEYDNVGLGAPFDLNNHSQGGVIYPLTVANTQVGTRGESPMYGALGFFKELLLKENGITFSENDFQLLTVNNGYSGATVESLSKGNVNGRYQRVIDLVTSTKPLAAQAQQSYGFLATIWAQGHNNGTGSDYKALLKQVATDLNADGKAATGQTQNHILFTYQTATSPSVAARQWVAGAQLAASNEHPLIVMCSPSYFIGYPADGIHWDRFGAKWIGGYYGLAMKRYFIDGIKWQPLQPVGHAVNGTTIDLIFNKTGLVFDTTTVAAQTNSGFAVTTSGGAAKTINSVAIIAPNRVRITLATAVAAGDIVYYGMTAAATGMSPFVGGAGNLRDSQGDFLTYDAISKPMHNWCALFIYSI